MTGTCLLLGGPRGSQRRRDDVTMIRGRRGIGGGTWENHVSDAVLAGAQQSGDSSGRTERVSRTLSPIRDIAAHPLVREAAELDS